MNTPTGRQWSAFYLYTAWSLVGVLVVVPLATAMFLGIRIPVVLAVHPFATTVLVAQIAIGAWSGSRALATWSAADSPIGRDRWDLPRVGRLTADVSLLVTAAVTGVIAVMVLVTGADLRLLLVSLALLTIVVVMRWRWEIGCLGAVLLAALVLLLEQEAPAALGCGLLVVAAVLTIRLSLWLAAMVRELDEAREAQTQLAVAEERLRFARDLHDVTGRDLSVIAVKSELVAQLAEREDPRAAEHGREAAQIARASLAEIRALVRGYREADLATELRGTASLLRSAHVRVTVDGDAEDVPPALADTAAWVLREGGTNILRHADATAVTIALDTHGITLVNDGAHGTGSVHEGSGLTGMRERLHAASALTVRREDDTFTLDVRFDTTGGPR